MTKTEETIKKASSMSSVITTYQVKCHKIQIIQELLFRNFPSTYTLLFCSI